MKAYVNGNEVDLESGDIDISVLPDRLMVKTPEGAFSAVAVRQGEAVLISFKGQQYRFETRRPRVASALAAGSGEIRAPMPGVIVDVLVRAGDAVDKGDKILVLEAMKTQQAFIAPFAGVVQQIAVKKGEQVIDGQLLALVQATATPAGE